MLADLFCNLNAIYLSLRKQQKLISPLVAKVRGDVSSKKSLTFTPIKSEYLRRFEAYGLLVCLSFFHSFEIQFLRFTSLQRKKVKQMKRIRGIFHNCEVHKSNEQKSVLILPFVIQRHCHISSDTSLTVY